MSCVSSPTASSYHSSTSSVYSLVYEEPESKRCSICQSASCEYRRIFWPDGPDMSDSPISPGSLPPSVPMRSGDVFGWLAAQDDDECAVDSVELLRWCYEEEEDDENDDLVTDMAVSSITPTMSTISLPPSLFTITSPQLSPLDYTVDVEGPCSPLYNTLFDELYQSTHADDPAKEPTPRSLSVFQLFTPPFDGPVSPFARAELRLLGDSDESEHSEVPNIVDEGGCWSSITKLEEIGGEVDTVGEACEDVSENMLGSQIREQRRDAVQLDRGAVGLEVDSAVGTGSCWTSVPHPGCSRREELAKVKTAGRAVARARRLVKCTNRTYREIVEQGQAEARSACTKTSRGKTAPMDIVARDFAVFNSSEESRGGDLARLTTVDGTVRKERKGLLEEEKDIRIQLDKEESAITALTRVNAMADEEISWLEELKAVNEKEKRKRHGTLFELRQKERWYGVRFQMLGTQTEAEARQILLKSYLSRNGLMSTVLAVTITLVAGIRGMARHSSVVSVVMVVVLCFVLYLGVVWKFGGWQS